MCIYARINTYVGTSNKFLCTYVKTGYFIFMFKVHNNISKGTELSCVTFLRYGSVKSGYNDGNITQIISRQIKSLKPNQLL